MMHVIKHKLRLALMVTVTLLGLSFAGAPAALAAAPMSADIWGSITCNSSTEVKVEEHTCCPKSVATVTSKDSNGKPIIVEKTPSSCLFAKYINPLVALMSAAVGIIVVISIIYGGIQYSTSGGDPQKAANGKNRIRNALIGLLAYLLLFAFLQFIIPGGKFNA